ncbi:uncharacterized protein A4U43_C10F10180 [Asparagus officinalis]|uniref:Uncharacterized protein n=1 Tax=Asparagus officinalis TaxID=4686 RepID=A0A5P1E2A3_ASPOF|nr:gibberellin-regulated protein 2-like [Asparagus officinalis]XP_020248164.1 gibberellin-regulated protein 2-like [Asparagus officinalis]ONK56569.1 uncharacterized protein A4U43_C10F10180 [Asparagus officinalis]
MAKTKWVLAVLLLLFLLDMDNFTGQGIIGVQGIDCGSKCAYRCSKASRNKMCLRACNTCCQRCSCVPPGTAGNQDVCPCYAKMTTHGGRLKCP